MPGRGKWGEVSLRPCLGRGIMGLTTDHVNVELHRLSSPTPAHPVQEPLAGRYRPAVRPYLEWHGCGHTSTTRRAFGERRQVRPRRPTGKDVSAQGTAEFLDRRGSNWRGEGARRHRVAVKPNLVTFPTPRSSSSGASSCRSAEQPQAHALTVSHVLYHRCSVPKRSCLSGITDSVLLSEKLVEKIE